MQNEEQRMRNAEVSRLKTGDRRKSWVIGMSFTYQANLLNCK